MGLRTAGWLALSTTSLFLSLVACSSSTPPADAPSEPPPSAEESGGGDVSEEEAALLAQIEESAAIADLQADGGTSDDWGDESDVTEDAKREVVYRVSNEGLKVEVMGAEFVPHAESISVRGGYGVKLTVTASTSQPLVLYAPVQGPLAFGGKVQGEEERKFGDRRKGGTEVAFNPGSPIQFERTWPAEDQEPLMPGEELELHVGLWGLGSSSDDRRPLNRFLVVKMSASKNGALPRVEPPSN